MNENTETKRETIMRGASFQFAVSDIMPGALALRAGAVALLLGLALLVWGGETGLGASAALAQEARKGADVPTSPTLNEGARWRLGFMEGGQYPDYRIIFTATLQGLADLGWMEPIDPPTPWTDPAPGAFWQWLVDNANSEYLEFVPDAYYAPGNFDEALRPQVRDQARARLAAGDLDLMVAMGTWAGQDLVTDDLSVPVVVGSTSDPIGAGIVDSAEDSGHDYVHAKVEPERYQRQVRIFHDLIGFTSLGIVYADSTEGRTYGGVDAVEQVASERGFEIVACHAPYTDLPQDVVEQGVVDCYAQVAEQAEAVYVTVHRGVTRESLPRIVEAINQHSRPSFSMLGSSEVRRGVLMSVAQADFSYVGRFHAEVIAKILNGAKPRDIDQRWSAPPKIALNLKEAGLIGFDPPVDILIASDEIYEDIEP